MEWLRGRQELRRYLAVCVMCCLELIHQKLVPLVGGPALPFIDQGGSRGYRWEKEENAEGIEGPLSELGLPFSMCLPCLTR